MTGKNRIIFKAVAVLALVWLTVWAVSSFAANKRITAITLKNEIAADNLEDWSQNPGSAAEARLREEKIRRISEIYNRLDFTEREKNRDSNTEATFLQKLTISEKELFINLTIVESMNRFMEALDQMPPEQRKRFVENGLQEIRNGQTEEQIAQAGEMDDQLLTKISEQGMRAYFDKASADTKLDLAPLMEAMNEVMQGLRGRDFGQ